MNPFEYIALLTSIVIALGITRVLTGVGRILQFRCKVRVYWVHALWAGNVFLWLLLNWWILYRWRTYENWTFYLYLFVLLSPVIAFLLSVLLLPEPLEPGTDLKHVYYANHRWFFALAALLPPIDALDTLLKGPAHFAAQGPLYVVTILLLFGLCVTAAITKSERYHAFFSVFFLLYILLFIAVNLRLLAWAAALAEEEGAVPRCRPGARQRELRVQLGSRENEPGETRPAGGRRRASIDIPAPLA